MSNSNDFPLVEAPAAGRKGVFSISMVLFSFTFFTGTMFAGGKLGVSFSIVNLLWIAVIGNFLLALYAASLGWIAARSGLNTVLMGRFCFGEIGSKLADFILGFAELGWYAWGTATVAISLVKILALPAAMTIPLMILFGILFCVTALVGYKGLDALSRVSVPLMFILLVVSMYLAAHHAGGWQAMTQIEPGETMTWSAVPLPWYSAPLPAARPRRRTGRGCSQLQPHRHRRQHEQLPDRQRADDYRRRLVRHRLPAGRYRGSADFAGAVGRRGGNAVPQPADDSGANDLQRFGGGLPSAAQRASPHPDRGCRRGRHSAGTIGGMYEMLIPFLVLLGSIIPPIGGVILADYWFYRGDSLSAAAHRPFAAL